MKTIEKLYIVFQLDTRIHQIQNRYCAAQGAAWLPQFYRIYRYIKLYTTKYLHIYEYIKLNLTILNYYRESNTNLIFLKISMYIKFIYEYLKIISLRMFYSEFRGYSNMKYSIKNKIIPAFKQGTFHFCKITCKRKTFISKGYMNMCVFLAQLV